MTSILRLGAASLIMLAMTAHAADIGKFTLENGAEVLLKDDFTWEYIVVEQDTQTLASIVLAQPELLTSTAKDGIKVSLANSVWDGERLGLTFDLTSSSSDHIVLVEVATKFYSDSGLALKTETLDVWKATFRLPETYLRKGEQRQSRTLWVEGIDKSQWQKQLLQLSISELKSR
ncbi:DUF3157 family protein [Shewanella sp. SR44-3]|uniref:DUF3157 family protein n=2 Tax=Shewanella TaxID=22 RepID=UPI0015F7AC31|nr:DUF3157 family protein [Shewanella sp. SR44-3]MBB1268450.1 DUF3157 family protein [Shewanella sp. SR44-3]